MIPLTTPRLCKSTALPREFMCSRSRISALTASRRQQEAIRFRCRADAEDSGDGKATAEDSGNGKATDTTVATVQQV